jgi:hypothetical protein
MQGVHAIAGREVFEERVRQHQQLHSRNGQQNDTMEKMTVVLSFPSPQGLLMKDWQAHRQNNGVNEAVIAAAAAMVQTAPGWLVNQGGPVARWEPMVHGCDQEHESAVCIRFLQVRKCGIDEMRTRLVIRQELVGIVNEIQQKCWTEHEPWKLEEVDFLGLINAEGKMEGMVTLARRTTSTTDQDLLVGSALAMMMGSNIQRGNGSWFKWCPVKGQLGSSRCGVVSISAARSKQGRIWRAVTIGRRVKGIPTLCITDDKDPTVKRIISDRKSVV